MTKHIAIGERGYWIPISANWVTGADASGVLHAISTGNAWGPAVRRRKTRDSECGKRVRLAMTAGDHVLMIWPPYVDRRCAECWESTGRQRPHPWWKGAEMAEDVA